MPPSVIIGVDEVGMGSIAGPFFVAAAAFHVDQSIVRTTYIGTRKDVELVACDSKLIKNPAHLEKLNRAIIDQALAHAIIERSASEIDNFIAFQLLPETICLAIARVMERLKFQYKPSDYRVILDGDLAVPAGIPCFAEAIAHADATHWQVGAASILAKAAYDDAMIRIAAIYPQYGFEKHKGYPTPDHKKRLKELGPCPIHRRTTKPVQALLPLPKGITLRE